VSGDGGMRDLAFELVHTKEAEEIRTSCCVGGLAVPLVQLEHCPGGMEE
jgi:hypothetical protein